MPKFEGIIKQETDFVTLDKHIRMPQDSEYKSSEDESKEASEDNLDSDTVSNNAEEVSPKSKKTTKR